MKAISLWQPWATLWAAGLKQNETRDWPFPFIVRERVVAIHAASKWSHGMASFCLTEPFASLLRSLGYEDPDDLPRGAIVGSCKLVFAYQITEYGKPSFSSNELALGDYSPGRWIWRAEEHRRLKVHVSCKGTQGFFECPIALDDAPGSYFVRRSR